MIRAATSARDVASSSLASARPTSPAAHRAELLLFGIDASLSAVTLANGSLRVALRETATNAIVRQSTFRVSGALYDDNWRLSLHAIADVIVAWVADAPGVAASRIAYVREGRVFVIDSDGYGAHAVTARGLSPKWTPDGRALVYNVLDFATSPIMTVDLATRAERALTTVRSSAGQDYAAVVSPDGTRVYFTRSSAYSAEVFAVPFAGGKPERVTSSRGLSSNSPTVSPDGRQLAYMSDRAGRPDTYVANIDGTNSRVLTTASIGARDWHTNPDWSPDGCCVAYQSGRGVAWQVLLVDVRNGASRQLTFAGSNYDPSWAPDAAHLVVTSSRGGSQLWIVNAMRSAERQLTTGASGRGAAWSPRLRVAELAFPG